MMSMNLSVIAVLNNKGSDYWSFIGLNKKGKAIKLIKNIKLPE